MPPFDIRQFLDAERAQRDEDRRMFIEPDRYEPIIKDKFFKNEFNYNIIKHKILKNELNNKDNIIHKPIINMINNDRLDDLYRDYFIDQNIRPANNYDHLIHHDFGNLGDGFLSERLGKMFSQAELEGLEVELVALTPEEEMTIFDAHVRFVHKTADRIAKQYQDKTGQGLTDGDHDALSSYVSLSMKHRKKLDINEAVEAIENGTLHEKVQSLSKKSFFTPQQLQEIERASNERGEITSHRMLFEQGNQRYFKIQATGESKTQATVESALNALGYTITDYQAGKATELDETRHGKQQFKIGKLLKDDSSLLKEFGDDPIRVIGNLMVVMSRDPMDIAMMSTNKGWRSCMSNDGMNFRYVYEDIRKGTVVSYLTSMTDPHAYDPLSRVSLKPFTKTSREFASASSHEDNDVIFRPGPNYGIPNAIFYRALQRYAQTTINAGKEGTFTMVNGLYQDGMKRTISRTAHAQISF